jgi:eukaryotic-like serine/threonine-protein kinase
MSAKAYNLSKYQLIECIAHGGMGEVWKAFDTQLRRNVAIKLLHPGMQQNADFIMRFEQEARLIASLRHPNIIKIHDFKVDHHVSAPESHFPLCYMVMDYVEGGTLADYIRDTSRCGKFPFAVDIVYLFTVVGLALDYAHQCSMIHRDIKPANILLDKRISTIRPMGEPILTDFGIARQRGTTTGTVVGSFVGTPKYIAPEQAQGQYDDPRSDVYSLGIILYEIMTGNTPFNADTQLAIVMQHLQEQPKPPDLINPHVSPALSEVILKSIAKEPNARFPTATALALALIQAFNISAPEHLGGSSERTLPGSSSSAFPLTDPGVHTPLIGVSLNQGTIFSGSQSDQSIQAGSSAKQPRNPRTPINALANQSMPLHSQLGASPYVTPLLPYSISAVSGGLMQHENVKRFRHNNKQTRLIGLTALLVLVLLGSGLIARIFLFPPSLTATVIGHVSLIKYASSPTYNAAQIDIAHVPELPPGMAYYAWIELVNGQDSEKTISPHWKLTVSNQAIHTPPLTFAGFDNLYLPHSLFLITRTATDSSLVVPDIDPTARLYYARMNSPSLDLQQCPTNLVSSTCF